MTESTDGYEAESEALVPRYERIRFEELHRATLHLFPAPPARVLDIGAGTGRDAAALSRRGHAVTAVEPTAGLRSAGQTLHAGLGIDWLDDTLPDLAALAGREGSFDLCLMTAVLMHLDVAERAAAIARLAELLSPGGRLILSLRHGPVPEGRRMFEVSGDSVEALVPRHGLAPVFRCAGPDIQARPDVTWTWLAFEKNC